MSNKRSGDERRLDAVREGLPDGFGSESDLECFPAPRAMSASAGSSAGAGASDDATTATTLHKAKSETISPRAGAGKGAGMRRSSTAGAPLPARPLTRRRVSVARLRIDIPDEEGGGAGLLAAEEVSHALAAAASGGSAPQTAAPASGTAQLSATAAATLPTPTSKETEKLACISVFTYADTSGELDAELDRPFLSRSVAVEGSRRAALMAAFCAHFPSWPVERSLRELHSAVEILASRPAQEAESVSDAFLYLAMGVPHLCSTVGQVYTARLECLRWLIEDGHCLQATLISLDQFIRYIAPRYAAPKH